MAVQYRHFNQSEIKIDNGGVKKFKRYIGDEQYKFIQFVEGTITEIKASDFEPGITTLLPHTLYYLQNLSYLELPDTIQTIQNDSIQFCNGLQKIIFPKNLISIGSMAIKDGNLPKVNIGDFSKCTQVPTLTGDSNSFCYYFTTIKVPANLLYSWKNSWDRANSYNNIVSA